MKPWQRAWRNGFAPNLTREQLTALRDGLANNDVRILQGATVSPPPVSGTRGWPAEYACPIGYCGWQAHGLKSTSAVEDFFMNTVACADHSFGEYPPASSLFLEWVDDTPREKMIRELLAEVELSLSGGNQFPPENSPGSKTPE